MAKSVLERLFDIDIVDKLNCTCSGLQGMCYLTRSNQSIIIDVSIHNNGG